VLAVLCAPVCAQAFCGFYVSGTSGKLFNDASMVVLLRDGTRTVLSMQNNYRGPPQDFALVVPVPVVLQKGNVTTLPREAFARLDEISSPRLVEVPTEACLGGLGSIAAMQGAGRGGAPMAESMPRDLGVKVEAKFDVEEYEIVILSAESSLGLFIWLRENKYQVPDGAEAALKPYVAAGSKFFVAKVDSKKVHLNKEGEAVLSPLRFSYDTESFTLPVRLGLLNSAGTQDLIVHVIAKSRYELANAKNVLVPTNIDVRTRTQPQFGGFYTELIDRTFKKNPGAAVTEFAWEGALPPPVEYTYGGGIGIVGSGGGRVGGGYGGSCDPPPPPAPIDNPLARYLGVGLLPKIKTDDGITAFTQMATVTRLHLRYTKSSAPDDLVFKAVEPISGGVPEVKTPGPSKKNRFQGRYIMWVQGCGSLGGGLGGLPGFFSAGSALNKPQAESRKLIDPFEQLVVNDVAELDVKAQPLSKDAPKLTWLQPEVPPAPLPPVSSGRSGGTVNIGGVDVQGELARDVAMRVVRTRLGAMRSCYERALNRYPQLGGNLHLRIMVTPTGTVASSQVEGSTLNNPEVEACIRALTQQMTFPRAPQDGINIVTFPLHMVPPPQ
jgi:hypothetical protein